MITLDFSPRRLDKVLRCEERNLAFQEMHEWREKVEAARRHRWPLPVAGGLIRARFEISRGDRGLASGWDIDTVPIADFGNVNAAGALTVRSGFNSFPLVNPVHTTGILGQDTDLEPFENPNGTLAATNASRVAGSSVNTLAVLVGVYVIHITSGAAVYQPAGTTFNARVISTALAVGAGFQTLATLNVATAANFVDQAPIAAPTERQLATPSGTLLSTVSGVYNGDSHFGELVMTGAVNHQGAILYAELEVI